MRTLTVRDVMSTPPITIRPYIQLPMIKQLMCEKRVHRLPVVDRDELLGIITFGDVRNAYPSDVPSLIHAYLTHSLDHIWAAEIMRAEVVTVQADAPLTRAVDLMLRHRISGLPVMDAQRLVGMITKSDICRALVAWEPAPAPQRHDTLYIPEAFLGRTSSYSSERFP